MTYAPPGAPDAKVQFKARYDNFIGGKWTTPATVGTSSKQVSLGVRKELGTATRMSRTMRRKAVYAATIVGRPPMEDFYLGHATERIFLPLLKLTIPEIVDYHMPAEGVFHNLVFVSIKKEYPGQAYKVMNAMWGQGLMSLA